MRACKTGSHIQGQRERGLQAELSTVQLADGSLLSWCIELTEAANGGMFGLCRLGLQSSPDPDSMGEANLFPVKKRLWLIPELQGQVTRRRNSTGTHRSLEMAMGTVNLRVQRSSNPGYGDNRDADRTPAESSAFRQQVLIRWSPNQVCGKATMQKECMGYKCLSSLTIQASSAGCETPCSPVGGAEPPVPSTTACVPFAVWS